MNAALALPAPLSRWPGFVRNGLFSGALRRYDDERLCAHFRERRGVRYFPVADPEETRRDKIDALLGGEFDFNGETHRLGARPRWLDNPSRDLEWHIALHKFYYAVGLGMAFQETRDPAYLHRWMELTDSWIAAVPPGFIAADVTGRRVQNWIYAYYYFVVNNHWEPVPGAFHRRLLESLHQQVHYLCDNLHPARNHRTLELYAIFLASVVFPEFRAAPGWRRFALDRLVENVCTDLLPDGVHCELSTDYHHLVLKNLLCMRRLAALNDIAVPARLDERLRQALDFAAHAHKPDGLIPALSDGDSRSFLDLLLQGYELYGNEEWLYVGTAGRHGRAPRQRSRAFDHAGYYFLRSGWGRSEPYAAERYLAFDCGPLGAGNHGHLDALNVELAAYGRSLVVDPGRYTYDEGGPVNWRVRFRGTAAHNTVQVDGEDQTAYLPRPGKRHKIQGPAATATLHRRAHEPGLDYLHGSARSHRYAAVHHRHIFFVDGRYWLILDRMQAPGEHRYELRYQLSEQAHDRLEIEQGEDMLLVRSPQLLVASLAVAPEEFSVEPGQVSYRYGCKHPAPVLRYARRAADTLFATLLCPFAERAPAVRLASLPVSAARTAAWAFRVELDDAGERRADLLVCNPGGQEIRVADRRIGEPFLWRALSDPAQAPRGVGRAGPAASCATRWSPA